ASGVHTDTTATACGSFSWQGQTYTQSGDYDYVSVNGACQDTVTLHLTVGQGNHSDTTAVSCNAITWYGLSYAQSGDYNHISTNAGGCPDTVTLHLTINGPTLRITDPAASCNGGSVDITAAAVTAGSSAGLTYTYWQNADANIPLLNPSAVSVSSTCYIKGTAGGCSRIAPVQVRISNLALAASAQNLSCSDRGGAITATATNGMPPYSYSIDGGSSYQPSGTFGNLSAGSYLVLVQDGAGCNTQVPATLQQTPSARIEGGAQRCSPGTDTLYIHCIGTAPWTLVYTEGDSTRTLTGISSSPYALAVSPASTTIYTLQSVSDIRCTNSNLNSSATIAIDPGGAGTRYPTEIADIFVPKQLRARNLGTNCTYQWMPPTGLNRSTVYDPVFYHNQDQEYLIRIDNGSGCKTVDTVLVQVRTARPQNIVSDIFVPKAWSPNNDGHNDRLYPLTVNIRELYYFRIFNRWGQLMFETNIIGFGWDGLFKGQPQVNDTYTWTLEAVGEDGKYYKRSGNSVLLR
ncbi:T9SS type B sorting domain-containing protein, partial [Flaviaesturariibacter aridisoli]